jgi:hypothetical protein
MILLISASQVARIIGMSNWHPVWGFLFCGFETGSCCVSQVGLNLMILLPQPAECWNYRCVASDSFYCMKKQFIIQRLLSIYPVLQRHLQDLKWHFGAEYVAQW